MHRSRWSRVSGYLKSSLWVVPLIAIPLGMITTRILHWLDGHLAWTLTRLRRQGLGDRVCGDGRPGAA